MAAASYRNPEISSPLFAIICPVCHHVNAFTPGTIRHACEYAGFATKKMFRWSLPIVNRAPFLPLRLTGLPPFSAVARAVMYIGEKIPGWDYPERASRRASDNRQGYLRK